MLDLAKDLAADEAERLRRLARPATAESSARFMKLFAEGDIKVPPYPAIAVRINDILKNPKFGIPELQKAVQADATVSANVLRVANSPFYARAAPAESLKTAIVRIGVAKLSTIAMTAAMSAVQSPTSLLRPLRIRAWRDSVATATIAQSLCASRGRDPDLGFTCGLLHDLGTIAAISSMDSAAGRRAIGTALPESEWPELVRKHSVELGAKVAANWDLPAVIQDVIAHYRKPQESTNSGDMVRTVAVACRIVRLMNEHPSVSAATLNAAIRGFSPQEVETLVKLIPTVPGFLAGFNEAGPTGRATQMVSPDAPGVHKLPPETVSLGVTRGTRTHLYEGVMSVPGVLVVDGDTALDELTVHPFAPKGVENGALWSEVLSCHRRGNVYRMELRPFGLTPEIAAIWEIWQGGAGAAQVPHAVPPAMVAKA